MNYEENRLDSFRNWPSTAEIEPIRIAKAGFFYTGQGVEVQCFSCGGKISEWNYGDQVMVRHRRLDPNCPFVVNPSQSGNVALSVSGQIDGRSNQGTELEDNNDEIHRNDALRLLTFIQWPVAFIPRESLVRAGFYHLGEGKVRCAWCGGELAEAWRPGDDPLRQHLIRFPHCSYAQNISRAQSASLGLSELVSIPVPQDEMQSSTSTSNRDLTGTDAVVYNTRVLSNLSTKRALGVLSGGVDGARNPQYGSFNSRLTTFTNWPRGKKQSPEALSDAGFFYTGNDDQVRCFYCEGGLGKWEPTDTPWAEHARWFPDCGYVLLVKGKEFIEQHRERSNSAPRTVNIISADTALRQPRNNDHRVQFPVSAAQVTAEMESPHALAALGAGLDVARVRKAILRRFRLTGVGYTSAEALIDAALDEQLNEEVWGTGTPSAGLSSERLARDMMAQSIHNPVRNGMNVVWEDTEGTDGSLSPVDSRQGYSSRRPNRPTPSERPQHERQQLDRQPESRSEEHNPAGSSDPTSERPAIQPLTVKMPPSPPPRAMSLEEENRQLKEARLCKVCMDGEVSVVFLPCGHLVSCGSCGAALAACPLCRAPVKALVRAYLA